MSGAAVIETASEGTAPTAAALVSARVRFLDALRGVALLGILPVNMPAFALPVTVATEAAWLTGGAIREHVAFHATKFFFELKFITLFSLLFGVGMMILRIRAESTGRRYVPVMLRRLGALLAFGLIHVFAIWFGDILTYYALIGLLSFWMTAWSPRALRSVGAVLLLLPVAGMALLAVVVFLLQGAPELQTLFREFSEPGGDGFVAGSTLGSWTEFFRSLEHFGPGLEAEVYREGNFARITFLRGMTWFVGTIMSLPTIIPRVGGLFLFGMAWAKDGWFLDPVTHRASFARLVA